MPKVLGARPDRTTTAQEHELGAIYEDETTGNIYRYISAQGAITQYAPVQFDGGWDCPVAGNAGLAFGVAQVAIADNSYGWLLVRGTGTADVTTSTADNAPLARLCDSNGDLTTTIDIDEGGATAHGVGASSIWAQTSAAEASGIAAVVLF